MVDVAGKDEEVVAEAVDVGEDCGVDVCAGVGEGKDVALGTAADGAGYVGVGRSYSEKAHRCIVAKIIQERRDFE